MRKTNGAPPPWDRVTVREKSISQNHKIFGRNFFFSKSLNNISSLKMERRVVGHLDNFSISFHFISFHFISLFLISSISVHLFYLLFVLHRYLLSLLLSPFLNRSFMFSFLSLTASHSVSLYFKLLFVFILIYLFSFFFLFCMCVSLLIFSFSNSVCLSTN